MNSGGSAYVPSDSRIVSDPISSFVDNLLSLKLGTRSPEATLDAWNSSGDPGLDNTQFQQKLSDAFQSTTNITNEGLRHLTELWGGQALSRRRRNVIDIVSIWHIWPWEVTSFPVPGLSQGLLSKLAALAKRVRDHKSAATLLEQSIEDRLSCKRKAQGPRATRRELQPNDIECVSENLKPTRTNNRHISALPTPAPTDAGTDSQRSSPGICPDIEQGRQGLQQDIPGEEGDTDQGFGGIDFEETGEEEDTDQGFEGINFEETDEEADVESGRDCGVRGEEALDWRRNASPDLSHWGFQLTLPENLADEPNIFDTRSQSLEQSTVSKPCLERPDLWTKVLSTNGIRMNQTGTELEELEEQRVQLEEETAKAKSLIHSHFRALVQSARDLNHKMNKPNELASNISRGLTKTEEEITKKSQDATELVSRARNALASEKDARESLEHARRNAQSNVDNLERALAAATQQRVEAAEQERTMEAELSAEKQRLERLYKAYEGYRHLILPVEQLVTTLAELEEVHRSSSSHKRRKPCDLSEF